MHVARLPIASARDCVPEAWPRRRGVRALLTAGIVLFDAVTFCCSYFDWLHFRGAPALSQLAPAAICLGAVGAVFLGTERYNLPRDSDSARAAAEHGLACLLAFALALLLQFATVHEVSRSRLALAGAFVLFTPITLVARRLAARHLRGVEAGRTILVVGAGRAAIDFYRCAREAGERQAMRFLDLTRRRAGTFLDGVESLVVEDGTVWAAGALVPPEVEAIVLTEPVAELPAAWLDALVRTHFRQVPLLSVEAFHERYWRKLPVTPHVPDWAFRQDFRLARDSASCLFKRAFDLIAGLLGLALAAPVLAACALALRVESSEPVLYRQTRVCRDRRSFELYKFRTMRAQEVERGIYTGEKDLRVTRVGRWLRRARLDELPQLFNVVRGEMSLIGPRAEWDRCVAIYEREISYYHFRHLVKPGITGWAQVNYPYGSCVEDTVEKLKYDLYYIKNYSLLLDASIVLKTLYVMLSFKGK